MKTLNDDAWERIFERYNILDEVNRREHFRISATQIKEFREPRLMTKFDHAINLPKIFLDNNLTILPVARGDYLISHFEAYHTLEDNNSPIIHMPLPNYIQSLDMNNIFSESVALNCAFASGIIAHFLNDDYLLPTISGRMGSGNFNFNIFNSNLNSTRNVTVSNSQIEIDAAYEGIQELALFEAKRDLSDDFLIRQLYYPYRTWVNRVNKLIRPVFLIYSNGIYHLYEYVFHDMNDYNSLFITRNGNYSIEDTSITSADIQDILNGIIPANEPEIPFPQANCFERVINLCELLNGQNLSREEITERYAFDLRQTYYYTDAALYLGLIDKHGLSFSLNEEGIRVFRLNYKQRQLAFCRSILSHCVFANTLRMYFESGNMPTNDMIIQIMRSSNFYNDLCDSTIRRRSATIKGWINWIISLIND